MTEVNFDVFPWDLSKFKGSSLDKRVVLEKLSERDYDINQYKSLSSDSKEAKISHAILRSLEANQWVLFLANDVDLIYTISRLVPIIYALSTMRSVVNVSNDYLERVFQYPYGQDAVFGIQADLLSAVNKTSLVVHENINEGNYRLRTLRGSILEFIKYRRKPNNRYFMTGTFAGEMSDDVKREIYNSIGDVFGPTVLNSIRQKASFMYASFPQPPKRWESIKVK